MKRILTLMFAMLMLLTLLCSCLPMGGTGGGSTEKEENDKENNGDNDSVAKYQVVFSKTLLDTGSVVDITNALNTVDKTEATFVLDSVEKTDLEIVFGKTTRAISTEAYRLLERMDAYGRESRFLIYSDGKSVAIAFDEDEYGIFAAAKTAAEYFIENYVKNKSTVSTPSGKLYSDTVDPIEYQRKVDIAKRDAAIETAVAKIEDEELREEVALAIKEYYGLMSFDMLVWLANLYDPEIGGFYYSNSARYTEGYLPDIESTGQALTIIKCCGILDAAGTSELNELIGDGVVSFVKPLQDPNGYFYHPQWTKAMTDKLVERRARDLSNALSCLGTFGAKPTYDTPTGVKGDGIILSSALTEKLGFNTSAIAVSKVLLTSSDYVSPALRDEASFREYLKNGDVKNRGYGFGSELSSQVSEIIHRDKQLRDEGADYSLCEILIEYLNENQNPENGVWYWVDKSDPKYSYYAGVNGLLKISGIYTAVGVEFPNAVAASKTAIEAIYSSEDPVGIVDIYNTWFAIENLIKNLRSCASNKEEGDENVKALRNELLLDAPGAIRATMQKLSLFRKLDGSFSYLQKSSSPTSSGMQVAVPNTNEGDVNATVIGGLDTGDRMFSVLGLPVPELYSIADYCEFMDTLKNLNPVSKNPEPEREPISYDYDEIGSFPGEAIITNGSTGLIEVIADPREGSEGNVLYFETHKDGNDTVEISSGSGSLGTNCLVFSTDMCVLSGEAGYACQIYIEESYMLCLRLDKEGVGFFDSSSPGTNKIDVDFCKTVPFGQWFNLRIEYYPGTHDTVRAKVCVDGEVIAVSDNYYDYYGHKITSGTGSPGSYYSSARIFTMRSSEFVMMIDNTLAAKTKDSYKPFTDPDKQPVVNVDAPEREEKVYGFDSMPEDISVTEGLDKVEISEDDELILKGGAVSGFNLSVPANIRIGGADCSVLEMVGCFDSVSLGALIELDFSEMSYNEKSSVIYHLGAKDIDGNTFIAVYEASGGATGAMLGSTTIPVGESFKLRIEYYKTEGATLLYINEELVAMSATTCTGANKYTVGKLKVTNLAKGAFELTIDSLKFERDDLSFEEATEPSADRIIHDFEAEDEDVTLGAGSEIVTASVGKAVSLKGAASYLDIPVNKRSDVCSAAVLEAVINFESHSSNKAKITLASLKGDAVLTYELRILDGKACLFEVSESKVYEVPILEFSADKNTVLRIEYYPSVEVVHLYVNGTVAAITNLTYSGSYDEISSVRFYSTSQGGALTVDNVYLESLNKLYIPESYNAENSEDSSERLTFESSTGGNLPSAITAALNSGGASVKVKEYTIGDGSGKALALKTNAGGADTLKLSAYELDGTFNAMILEARIKCDYSGNVYLFFFTKDGKQAYRINLNVDKISEGGGVRIDDNSGLGAEYGYGTLGNPLSGKNRSEWFDLRIEFTHSEEGKAEARIYVDGRYFATSREGAWAAKDVTEIAYVEMTTGVSTSGEFLIDEITLHKGNVTE